MHTIIALDDWAIYALDDDGQLVVDWSEVWPEWLDFETAPEDMSDRDFKRATLLILDRRRDDDTGFAFSVPFVNYREWYIGGERSWAESLGCPFDSDAAIVAAEESVAEVLKLAEEQAPLLARLTNEIWLERVTQRTTPQAKTVHASTP